MHFDLTPDQRLFVDAVAAFAKRELAVGRVRKLRDDALGYSRHAWRHMGELGWLALPFDQAIGGAGSRFVDVALLLEELGRHLASEPYVASVVLAGTAIARAGTPEQRARYLVPLMEGEATLGLAYAERAARFDPAYVATRLEREGSGWRLRGEKVCVLNGHAADALVVSARVAGDVDAREGLALAVTDRLLPGVTTRAVRTLDGQRVATCTFDAALPADAVLGEPGRAAPLIDELCDLGAAAACAEGAGLVRQALDLTLAHLRSREQFGVKIGSFQALQHRAVDMFVAAELVKSTALLAALKVGARDADERAAAVSAAKVQLAEGGRFVTQQAVQLHGALGVCDEHDIGLYLKRMQVLAALFGDAEHHVARFAARPAFLAVAEA